jgi:hypothetical protein
MEYCWGSKEREMSLLKYSSKSFSNQTVYNAHHLKCYIFKNQLPYMQGFIYCKIPSPPQGGGNYQPMSFGGENMKRGSEKGEKCKGKGKKGERNEQRGSKRVK